MFIVILYSDKLINSYNTKNPPESISLNNLSWFRYNKIFSNILFKCNQHIHLVFFELILTMHLPIRLKFKIFSYRLSACKCKVSVIHLSVNFPKHSPLFYVVRNVFVLKLKEACWPAFLLKINPFGTET